jgi:ribosomal protein S18 acetylase RimI-like enzyme
MYFIRRATEADAAALSDIARRTFVDTFAEDNSQEDMDVYVANTYSVDLQLQEIRDPNRRIEIAWADDGRALGFFHLLAGQPDPSVTGSRPIELLRLYVDTSSQGKGVGAALMDKAVEIARAEGYDTMWLGVWERNFKAQAFYVKSGFTQVGQHVFRLGTDDQTDLIMSRFIGTVSS